MNSPINHYKKSHQECHRQEEDLPKLRERKREREKERKREREKERKRGREKERKRERRLKEGKTEGRRKERNTIAINMSALNDSERVFFGPKTKGKKI